MRQTFETRSPIDGAVLFTRDYASSETIEACLQAAEARFHPWKSRTLSDRISVLHGFVDAVTAQKELLAKELSQQMGRPIRYTAGEIGGFEQRAKAMLKMAPDALADIVPPEQTGFRRFVRREPLGVVLVLSPWNYPLSHGRQCHCSRIGRWQHGDLKHSEQTALVAERLKEAADAAGLPEGLLQIVHCTHDQVAALIEDTRIGFVAFTGSVEGGQAVTKAAATRFVGLGLELGGKDPAYVRADANFEHAVENVVDGAFSILDSPAAGLNEVYVHESIYDSFVAAFAKQVKGYVLGDPMNPETTLGPMVRPQNADHARRHIQAAIAAGAQALIDPSTFPADKTGTAYLALKSWSMSTIPWRLCERRPLGLSLESCPSNPTTKPFA